MSSIPTERKIITINIEHFPPQRIAFIRQTGPYGPANKQAMESLKSWARHQQLLTDSATLYGIAQDNPDTTSSEQCRYDACIVIPAHFQVDSQMQEGKLPGVPYAVFRVKHTAEAIQHAWQYIFGVIQQNGYQLNNRPLGDIQRRHDDAGRLRDSDLHLRIDQAALAFYA